eukprot:UN08464
MKPAIKEAYKAAKNSQVDDDDDKMDQHYVDRKEFKTLVICLGRYMELYAAFEGLDTEDGHRLDMDEFKKGVPLLEVWGIEVKDPEAAFKEVDADGFGKIII